MRARLGIIFLLLAAVGVAIPVLGASPSAGTIGVSNRRVTWQSSPFTVVNPAGPTSCSAASCDEFFLTVAVPSGYWTGREGGVTIRTEWESSLNDWDLFVYDAAGKEVGSDGAANTDAEQVFLEKPKPGVYKVVMTAFAVVQSSYTGTATLADVNIPKGKLTTSTMKFSPTTIVDPQFFGIEPSIWVHTDGTVYLTAIAGASNTTSYVWRSRDGGRSFDLLDAHLAPNIADPRHRPCTASGGGADADIIVDRTNRVMLSDLQVENIAINVSEDGGDTWKCNANAASTPEEDRQWLAPSPSADGTGPNVDAYHVYRDLAVGALPVGNMVKPIQMHVDVTHDGGSTWSAQSTYGKGVVSQSGPIFTHADGTVYQVYAGQGAVWMARSTDEAKTWTLKKISTRMGTVENSFVAGDVDEAGNLYVAWVEGGSWDVMYTSSTDRAEHWTEPVRINPPASETADFPWLAAGKAGDVAIAWYGAEKSFTPDTADLSTRWNVWAARTLEANKPNPTFEAGPMTVVPSHFGAICNSGLSCDITPVPGDRSLGDFFEIDIAPDGTLMAVFNDNGRIYNHEGYPGTYVAFVRQIGGLGMSAAARSKAAIPAVDARGDARYPRLSASGAPVPSLDILDANARYVGDKLEVSFRLADATALADAIKASDQAGVTDAYWIAMWRAAGRQMYAGLHVGSTGGTTFFGGNEPGAVEREPNNPKYATYPNQITVKGTVDAITGRVTIIVPLTDYKFSIDEPVHALQVFSATGAIARTMPTPLTVYDATAARTIAAAWTAPGTGPVLKPPKPRVAPQRLPATGVGSGVGFAALSLAGAAALTISLRRRDA